MISAGDIPLLPRGVRCWHDRVRGVEVLLGPERVLMLDGVGKAVLSQIDGETTVKAICASLARDYDTPKTQILEDVLTFLNDLFDKRLLERTHG